MRLIDSHGHLQAEAFADDADEVIAAAQVAGVERILAPGWDPASSAASIALAARHDLIDAVGRRPSARRRRCRRRGIGPRSPPRPPIPPWSRWVRRGSTTTAGSRPGRHSSPTSGATSALALETGKPAILHCRSRAGERDAQDELIVELRAAGVGGSAWHAAFGERPPAVLHSFSGPVDYAEAALEMGLAISFSGLAFRAGEEASSVVAHLVPDDRVLVETDSPYLSPPGAPRRRNEPLWVDVTARWLATWRKVAPDALGERLVMNYDAIFRSRSAT